MSFPDFVCYSEAVPPHVTFRGRARTWLSEAVPAGPRASFRTWRHSAQLHKYNAGAGFPTPAPANGRCHSMQDTQPETSVPSSAI